MANIDDILADMKKSLGRPDIGDLIKKGLESSAKRARTGENTEKTAPPIAEIKTPSPVVVTIDPPKTDPVKTDPVKTDPVKTDPVKTDPPKTDPAKTDPPKTDPPKTDPAKTDPLQTDSSKLKADPKKAKQ